MKAEKTMSKAQSLWLVSAASVVAIGVAALWLVWGVSTIARVSRFVPRPPRRA